MYEEDARVEVFDGDRKRWCPGTVQSTWNAQGLTEGPTTDLGKLLVVRSDEEFEGDLPLMWAIPAEMVETFVRPIQA